MPAGDTGPKPTFKETPLSKIARRKFIQLSAAAAAGCFVQAGREVRILVESQEISDDQAVVVARQIAQDIEKELAYPGQIKVTVIRETRAVDYAK